MTIVFRVIHLLIIWPVVTSAQVPVVLEPQPFDMQLSNVGSITPKENRIHPSAFQVPTNQKEVYQLIMKEVEFHERSVAQKKERIAQALLALEENAIYYEYPANRSKGKLPFSESYNELNAMINGGQSIDLKRAVFLVESAYDTTLQYEQFNRQLKDIAYVLTLKMRQDKINPKDNVGKIMTIYQYMTDTIKVRSPATEKVITSYPKTYDFNDFWGRKDYSKMFVSKLMREGSGQCHSLPLLFLLLASEIEADAHLAFAPNHSFIKFQDNKRRWHNIELTSGVFASDHFMVESGYIKAEALRNRIYLEPIDQKGVIVQCLNDLAMGYSRRFGYDEFVLQCSMTSLRHVPNSLSAHQLYSNYYNSLVEYVAWQYMRQGRTQSEFRRDLKAMDIYSKVEAAIRKIESLGYSDMPPEAYAAWLKACQEQAAKQEHLNEIGLLKGMIEK